MTRRPRRDKTQKEATATSKARQITGGGLVTRPGNLRSCGKRRALLGEGGPPEGGWGGRGWVGRRWERGWGVGGGGEGWGSVGGGSRFEGLLSRTAAFVLMGGKTILVPVPPTG